MVAHRRDLIRKNNSRYLTFRLCRAAEEAPADGAAAAADDADDAGDDDDSAPKPDPQVAIDALTAARGELTVLIDLLDNVAGQQALAVQFVEGGLGPLQAWEEATLELLRCRARLSNGAARLREAAAQLRQEAAESSRFVAALAQLQVCALLLLWCRCPCFCRCSLGLLRCRARLSSACGRRRRSCERRRWRAHALWRPSPGSRCALLLSWL